MSMFLDKTLLEEVSLLKDINEEFIEKDWFVTQVIKLLAEYEYLDFAIIFAGGTSLSKAHKLIQRFSEDIDFRIDAPSLVGQSDNYVRKALSKFKNNVVGLLTKQFSIVRVDARDSNRHIMIGLAYPTLYGQLDALRPHIKLELTLSSLHLPAIFLPVSSFINEVVRKSPEVAKIACIDPVENAADKLSALVWRVPSRSRGENDRQPDLVRHLHDLALLSKKALDSPEFVGLARATIDKDDNRSDEIAGLGLAEKLAGMVVVLETETNYPDEYQTFVNGMTYGKNALIPTFNEALASLKRIIARINDSFPALQ
jgi:predicted nucleotidyltransferase component of viral defense system